MKLFRFLSAQESRLIVLSVLLITKLSSAEFYHELNFVSGWTDQNGTEQKAPFQMNAAGFELYLKNSRDSADFLTVDLQGRLIFDKSPRLQLHNFFLEYNRGIGRKLRIGHFSPAFGLEPVYDSHATLFQTMSSSNLGFKNDWGLKWKNINLSEDMELALQAGSGMGLITGKNWLLSAAVRDNGYDFSRKGFSFAVGKLITGSQMWSFPEPEFTGRKNVMLLSYHIIQDYGLVKKMTEITTGKNIKGGRWSALTDFSYVIPDSEKLAGRFRIEGFEVREHDMSGSVIRASAGLEFRLDQETRLEIMYRTDLHNPGQKDNGVFLLFNFTGRRRN